MTTIDVVQDVSGGVFAVQQMRQMIRGSSIDGQARSNTSVIPTNVTQCRAVILPGQNSSVFNCLGAFYKISKDRLIPAS